MASQPDPGPVSEGQPASDRLPAPGKCRDRKSGKIDLTCELDQGHECAEHAPEPCPPGCEGGWHYAECTWHQEVRYDGAHHDTTTREVVRWEPVDHVAEAVRHLTAGMRKP